MGWTCNTKLMNESLTREWMAEVGDVPGKICYHQKDQILELKLAVYIGVLIPSPDLCKII